jgi:hypothetical protein
MLWSEMGGTAPSPRAIAVVCAATIVLGTGCIGYGYATMLRFKVRPEPAPPPLVAESFAAVTSQKPVRVIPMSKGDPLPVVVAPVAKEASTSAQPPPADLPQAPLPAPAAVASAAEAGAAGEASAPIDVPPPRREVAHGGGGDICARYHLHRVDYLRHGYKYWHCVRD